MIDLDRAMLDPSEVFTAPEEVASHPELTTEQKIQILRRWEYDQQEMSVAEEENMPGDEMLDSDVMDRIHQLLMVLEAEAGNGR